MVVTLTEVPSRPDVFVDGDGQAWQRLPVHRDGTGYAMTRLKGGKAVRLHTLVLEAFRGPRPAGAVARHLDGDRMNNAPENLVWGTQEENCRDTVRHGRSTRGERNGQAKLTAQNVEEIRSRIAAGETQSELAREFGISQGTVCDIKHGRTWTWPR